MKMTPEAIRVYESWTDGAVDDASLAELEEEARARAKFDRAQEVEERHMRAAASYLFGMQREG